MSVFNKVLGLGVAVFMASAVGVSATGDHGNHGGGNGSGSSGKKHCADVDVKVCFEEKCTITYTSILTNGCVSGVAGNAIEETKIGEIKVESNYDFKLKVKDGQDWKLRSGSSTPLDYIFKIYLGNESTPRITGSKDHDAEWQNTCVDMNASSAAVTFPVTIEVKNTSKAKAGRDYMDTVCVECVPCPCD